MEITKEQILILLDQAQAYIEKLGRKILGNKRWEMISSDEFTPEKYFEIKADAEKAKIHSEMIKNSSWEQFRNLESISALCATLLVIASFNDRVLHYDNSVKILLTILLLTIVICVGAFYKNFNNAQKVSLRELEGLTEKWGENEEINEFMNIINENSKRSLSYVPYVATRVVIIVILAIIYLIWNQ